MGGMIKMKNNILYDELKAQHQKKVNSLPMHFAFSESQFEELMHELGYDDKQKFENDICTIGAGSIILKKDKDLILSTLLENDKEMLKAFEDDDFLLSAFEYELANHEYIITYDIMDTLRALGISFKEYSENERMQKIMNQAIKNYKKDMEKYGW